MSALNQLLAALKVEANVFHNGQYCGMWAVDASGTKMMTFHVVSYGTCFLGFDGQIIELGTGDAVFFPSDARHRVSNILREDVPLNESTSLPMTDGLKDDATGLVCGHFVHKHPVFDKLVRQMPSSIIIRKDSCSASSSVIDLILKESKESGQSTNLLLNRLSDCLFYLLLRDHLDSNSGVIAALTHPKLHKPLELIHNSPSERLSVDDLADSAAMSRSAFSALFKEVLEQSPIEYITQWKMTLAYRWLADDGITTLDAAVRCGYESEASFSKAFKRVMDIGPGQARKKNVN